MTTTNARTRHHEIAVVTTYLKDSRILMYLRYGLYLYSNTELKPRRTGSSRAPIISLAFGY